MKSHLVDRFRAQWVLKRKGIQTDSNAAEEFKDQLFAHVFERKSPSDAVIGRLLLVRIPLSKLVSFRRLMEFYQRSILDQYRVEYPGKWQDLANKSGVNLPISLTGGKLKNVAIDPAEVEKVTAVVDKRIAPLTSRAIRVAYDAAQLVLVYDGVSHEEIAAVLYEHYKLRRFTHAYAYGLFENGMLLGEGGEEVCILHVPTSYMSDEYEEFINDVDAYARRRKLQLLL